MYLAAAAHNLKWVKITHLFRGFVKLKKIQKSEKNSEVGGWVENFVFFCLYCVVFMFLFVSKKIKKLDRGVGGWFTDKSEFKL